MTRRLDLKKVASRIVWFEAPDVALQNLNRFLAYAMTYATSDELAVLRQRFAEPEWIKALDNAPPGVFDARSWAYWNVKFGRYPVPPMPIRVLGAAK